MGSDQVRSFKKRFCHVKVKSLELASLRELGQQMDQVRCQAFSKAYGKIWDLAMIELAPTIEEFEGILGCPLGGRQPYLLARFYASMERIAKVVKILEQELDRVKEDRDGVIGIPRKCLKEKAEALANQGEWTSFIDILALLVFGTILFPNVDGLVDLATINTFLAYHHSKESLVIAILADAYDTFDLRCKKSSARIARRQLGYPMRGAPSEEVITPFIITRARNKKGSKGRMEQEQVLWGSSNELKLRRGKSDESRMKSMVLEAKLKACQRSKRSLMEQLSKTKENMFIIIYQYKEMMNLAATYGQMLEDEWAKVLALQIEREARERMIELLHREAMKWMNRFTLTLNESQEFRRLLSRAKAVTDMYSAPDKVHSLFDY
ncbi:hypothetical protein HKD37_13G035563 [Glycine soja]